MNIYMNTGVGEKPAPVFMPEIQQESGRIKAFMKKCISN